MNSCLVPYISGQLVALGWSRGMFTFGRKQRRVLPFAVVGRLCGVNCANCAASGNTLKVPVSLCQAFAAVPAVILFEIVTGIQKPVSC
jgi:hypothetical protein